MMQFLLGLGAGALVVVLGYQLMTAQSREPGAPGDLRVVSDVQAPRGPTSTTLSECAGAPASLVPSPSSIPSTSAGDDLPDRVASGAVGDRPAGVQPVPGLIAVEPTVPKAAWEPTAPSAPPMASRLEPADQRAELASDDPAEQRPEAERADARLAGIAGRVTLAENVPGDQQAGARLETAVAGNALAAGPLRAPVSSTDDRAGAQSPPATKTAVDANGEAWSGRRLPQPLAEMALVEVTRTDAGARETVSQPDGNPRRAITPGPRVLEVVGRPATVRDPNADTAPTAAATRDEALPAVVDGGDARLDPATAQVASAAAARPVWTAFRSEISARGFARHLSGLVGHPFSVEPGGLAGYRVVFHAADENRAKEVEALVAAVLER